MAEDVGLKIRVSADATGVAETFQKVSATVATTQAEFGKIVPVSAKASAALLTIAKSADTIEEKFAAAQAKVHGSIDKMVAEALGIAPAANVSAKALENLGRAPLQDLSKLDAQIKLIKGNISNVTVTQPFAPFVKGTEAAVTGLKKLKPGANEATQSLINLSRVAQDAPFGFLGIANNLNPLLESFQRLKASTGTTGSALKALAGSLTGAGGIGLALGVVSSLLVVFGDKLFGAKATAADLDKELNRLNATLAENKAKFDSVVAAAQHLQQLGSINLKVGGLNDRLGLQADAIEGREQGIILQRELNELTNQETVYFDRILKLQEKIDKIKRTPYFFRTTQANVIPDAELEIQQLQKAQAEIPKERQRLNDLILKGARATQLTYARIREDDFDDAEELKNIKPKKPPKIKPVKLEVDWSELQDITATNYENPLRLISRDAQDALEKMSKTQIKPFKFPVKIEFDVNANIEKGLQIQNVEKIKEIFKELGSVGTTAVNGIGDAFASFGEALVNGENALKAFGNSIVSAFSQVIQQLLKTAAIAAVLSLISGGAANGGLSFLSAFKIGLKGFAHGGLVSGPTLGLIGEGAGTSMSNPEVIAPLDKLKSLIGGAGGGTMRLQGEFIQRGNDLVAVINKTQRSQNRNF